jgi:hypothetical protein
MKRILWLTAILVFGFCVGAALPQSKVEPPKIPDATIAKFWKAQSQLQQAQAASQAAQQAMQAVVAEIQKACGEKFQAQMSPAGDPVCVAKPEAKRP